MYSTFSKASNLFTKFATTGHYFSRFQNTAVKFRTMNKFLMPVSTTLAYLYFNKKSKVACLSSNTESEVQKFQARRDNMKLDTLT